MNKVLAKVFQEAYENYAEYSCDEIEFPFTPEMQQMDRLIYASDDDPKTAAFYAKEWDEEIGPDQEEDEPITMSLSSICKAFRNMAREGRFQLSTTPAPAPAAGSEQQGRSE